MKGKESYHTLKHKKIRPCLQEESDHLNKENKDPTADALDFSFFSLSTPKWSWAPLHIGLILSSHGLVPNVGS